MKIEQAREIAAQIWCEDKNANKSMDHQLAESFAKKLVELSSDRIPASNRVMLATRTEAPITPELAERFAQVKSLRLLHVSMGLVTEAGEFMDMLKKHFFYGRPIDEVNAAEELGDLDWYMNLCCDVLHTTMAIIEVANIRKLATRYGDKFSEDKALLRNLSLELEGLQKDLSK